MSGIRDHLDRSRKNAEYTLPGKEAPVNLPSAYDRECVSGSGETAASQFWLGEDERVSYVPQSYVTFDPAAMQTRIDTVDEMIIEEVARSRYLTSRQIGQLISMRSVPCTGDAIRRHLMKLTGLRVLRQKIISKDGTKKGLRFYEIDVFGYEMIRERVAFHPGNQYLSYRKRLDLGIDETALDVKRILEASQILIQLLQAHPQCRRFGIMESFVIRPYSTDAPESLLRVPLNVILDEQSVLAYEIVRDSQSSLHHLEQTIRSYYRLIDLASSHTEGRSLWEDEGLPGPIPAGSVPTDCIPQLVLCVQNREHGRRVFEDLRKKDLLRRNDPLLFTEDGLLISDPLLSLYEICEDGSLQWYRIPGRSDSGEKSEYASKEEPMPEG